MQSGFYKMGPRVVYLLFINCNFYHMEIVRITFLLHYLLRMNKKQFEHAEKKQDYKTRKSNRLKAALIVSFYRRRFQTICK